MCQHSFMVGLCLHGNLCVSVDCKVSNDDHNRIHQTLLSNNELKGHVSQIDGSYLCGNLFSDLFFYF